jgi:hypothetical protein
MNIKACIKNRFEDKIKDSIKDKVKKRVVFGEVIKNRFEFLN